MMNPAKAFLSFTLASPGKRSAYLGLLGMVVIGLLSWLHYTQHEAMQGASRQLAELRQARIELAQGFLHVSLAGKPESPFSRVNGLALLKQSINTFERAMVSLDMGDRHEAEDFQRSVEAIRARLEDWSDTTVPEGRSLVALRIAFADLDRRANRLDNLGHRHIEALGARSDRVYAWSLAGSLLALALFIGIVAYSASRERKSFAEQARLDQARSDSEARFARLFHEAPLPLSLLTRNGVLRARNRRFDETFGYGHDELRNLDDWWRLAYPEPVYRAWVLETWSTAVAEAARQGTDIVPIEYTVTCKGGGVRVMLISGIALGEDFLATFFDVTERKQAEQVQAAALAEQKAARLASLNQIEDANAAQREIEATAARLRNSEALLRSATDNAAVGLVMLDLNRRYTFANPAYVDILGLPWTAEQLIGMGPAEALAAVYPTQISPRLDRAFAGERVTYELTRPRPGPAGDGSAHYVVVYDPVQGDTGGVKGVIVTIYDITEIKRAEAARRESQERLQLLIDHAPASLAMFDSDMRYLAVSRRWLDDYGLGDREILGHSHYEIFPDIPATWREVHRRGLAGEVIRADDDHFDRADGSVQWLRWEVRPWQSADGGIGGIVIFAEDITERKRDEQAIRQSEARFRGLVEQSLAGIYIIQDGRFRYVNQGFAAIFGYATPDDLIERVPVGDLVCPEDRARVAENVRRRIDGELTDIHYRFTGLRLDGERVEVEVHGRALDYQGRSAVIGLILDISERVRAETALHQLTADLEQRVIERTAELAAANKELDSFAYAVSHDLRAPLRAMSGFSQALKEDFGDRLEGDARVYLDQIGIASARMSELVDGLLVLSRSTRGDMRRDPVDLSALAGRKLDELARAEPGRTVRIEVEPGLSARGDARMVEAALGNLLANAWKYTGKATEANIRVHAGQIGETAAVCVADNGAGFDMAHASHLFQPFQRLHRQDEFPGIGIGLATVQRIVHRHGGVIEAHAEPGRGAVFCFTLPDKAGDDKPDDVEDVA